MGYFCPNSSQPEKGTNVTEGGMIIKTKIGILPHFSLITYQLIQHINCLPIITLRYYRKPHPQGTPA